MDPGATVGGDVALQGAAMSYRLLHKVALLALSCGLGACAVHPLPENVTGYDTVQIVHKIRCEARDAAIAEAIKILQYEGYPIVDGDVIALRAAIKPPKRQRKYMTVLLNTAIVFSFALQGTEGGGASASATVTKVISNGTQTIGPPDMLPSIGSTLMRDNIRAFTVSDNFETYINDTRFDRRCDFTPGPNYIYPITGRIGVDEMVHTFIRLTVRDNLGESDMGGGPLGSTEKLTFNKTPTMVDTITFTTTINAGIMPAISLKSTAAGWQFTDGSFTGTIKRNDVHQVIVGLAVTPPPPPSHGGTTHHAVATARALAAARVTPWVISAAPSTPAGEAAAAAVAQQIIRFQLPSPRIVAQ